MELPGAVENVCGVLGLAGFVDGGLRLPEYRPEGNAPIGEALAQYLQQANLFDFPAEPVHQLLFAVWP